MRYTLIIAPCLGSFEHGSRGQREINKDRLRTNFLFYFERFSESAWTLGKLL